MEELDEEEQNLTPAACLIANLDKLRYRKYRRLCGTAPYHRVISWLKVKGTMIFLWWVRKGKREAMDTKAA
ncbi:hypothetical protein B0X71_09470 [Planococcus lenghuensis]|uniref:Uncharacterized protein n=1 Tax=Planococcus lenghuensis TaxID=2213202 RepID=A0A1Q2KYS1_9BACL|nr:hypothetical protein B0X71_09470 [Planococcus lenghuensis]